MAGILISSEDALRGTAGGRAPGGGFDFDRWALLFLDPLLDEFVFDRFLSVEGSEERERTLELAELLSPLRDLLRALFLMGLMFFFSFHFFSFLSWMVLDGFGC